MVYSIHVEYFYLTFTIQSNEMYLAILLVTFVGWLGDPFKD